jgi:DNA polymerase-3 subunit gamma/tau
MSHQPLALKYRPTTFADVISQEHVTRTLRNALDGQRIAQAYLFAGPRGSGKTSTARILARALNCDRGVSGEPCGECDNCIAIATGRSLDVLEIDAASNRGIDDIKELRETVKYAPAQGRFKVYIVDEVHQLSKDAFNAFLKTLEEPPPGVVFVLATTEPHRILATILSRCQRFDFRPIPLAEIRDRLVWIAEREKIGLEAEAAFAIAKKADGSLRDALSLLDQVVAFGGDDVSLDAIHRLIGMPDEERYLELTELLATGDSGQTLSFVRQLRSEGYDLEEFYVGLLEHLRNCLLFAIGDGSSLAEVPERLYTRYQETADELGAEDLLRMLTLATEEEQPFRKSSRQSLVLEVLLVRLALLDRSVDLEAVLRSLGKSGRPPSRRATKKRSSKQRDRAGADQPASGAVSLTLDHLLAAWDEVLEAVHARRPTVAALLQGVAPSRCTADEIVLAAPADAEFRLEQLSRGDMLEPLVEILGQRWSFSGRVSVTETAAAEPEAQSAEKNQRPSGHELTARDIESRVKGDPKLQQAVDLFDASVVRVHRSSPAQS